MTSGFAYVGRICGSPKMEAEWKNPEDDIWDPQPGKKALKQQLIFHKSFLGFPLYWLVYYLNMQKKERWICA